MDFFVMIKASNGSFSLATNQGFASLEAAQEYTDFLNLGIPSALAMKTFVVHRPNRAEVLRRRRMTIEEAKVIPKGSGLLSQVEVKIGGRWKQLFDFFPDELVFVAEEFVGKTEEEGNALYFKKDEAYLKGASWHDRELR